MIGYCPSAGRIQPRHLLSFSTSSIAIAQVANTLSHNTHIVFLPLFRSPYRSFFLSILFSLTFSLFSSQPCATSTCLVSFVLESMPQLTSGKKKIGQHDGKLCPRRGKRRYGLTDLLRRPRTDASAHRVSFLRFSPARPLPITLSNRNPRPSS